VLLSSPACDDAWRRLRTKQFSGNGFAVVVRQCFSSACRVIAGIAIAAPAAASRCGVNNAVAPIGVTNEVPKGGSIIGTASGNIGGAVTQRQRP
jgi:hypothetical protein